MINGVPHKWCGKCRGGKGLWTVGDGAHHTHEHRGANAETAGQNESANLSQEVAEETANMAESPSYVNEPLEFGFIATCWDCKNPKELRGDH